MENLFRKVKLVLKYLGGQTDLFHVAVLVTMVLLLKFLLLCVWIQNSSATSKGAEWKKG